MISIRKGKGPNGADEVAYASTSMLPNSKRPVEKTNQDTGQALPMYAQVDKTKKTSNRGAAQVRVKDETLALKVTRSLLENFWGWNKWLLSFNTSIHL